MPRRLSALISPSPLRTGRGKLFIAITATIILLIGTDSPAADFTTATSAYDSGDYVKALREWRTLALAGDTEAQIALAGLYRAGLGRAVDLAGAAHWYRQAATNGSAVAQLNLAEMYEYGWGVRKDRSAAFIWYHRAAVQGRGWAATQRDNLAKRMTEAELAAAKAGLSASK